MNPDKFRQIEEVFHRARTLDGDQRDEYLDQACDGDAELRAQVESLLAHGTGDSRQLHLRDEAGSPPEVLEGTGDRIGRYKLLQLIGEGGFGVVYMAEQEEPVRRTVALKIIKPGMDSRQVIARFEAERQALAMMEHPNIAQVFDGGTTASGRPYFAMELVKGVPITEFCDANNLSMGERLELLVDVCGAVQHAHQKGVIHRDLKPSNVMVTLHDDRPVPKVIDFGVAKAIHQRLTEKTLFTEFRQFLGTPEYMSPEQAVMSGLDIDTRTDIYALGVLLYELLTGTTPFDPKTLRSAAFDELQRMIRETEPPRPSTRLETLGDEIADVARHRRAEPAHLRRAVRGDVDWIVMRAIEKDRTRRYATAAELAQDIQRHLGQEPVLAGPPSATYRMSKFVRRNRTAVAWGAVLATSVLLGLGATTVGFVRAGEERDRAVLAEHHARAEAERARRLEAEERTLREAAESAQAAADEQRRLAEESEDRAVREMEQSEAVRGFLQQMLASVDPLRAAGRETTVPAMLDGAIRRLDAEGLASDPFFEARVRSEIGRIYVHGHVGDLDIAEAQFQKAYDIWVTNCSRTVPAPGAVWGLLDIAEVREEQGDLAGAREVYREAVEHARRRTHDPEIQRRALLELADFLLREDLDAAEAEALVREALARVREARGGEHRTVAETRVALARALSARGLHAEAGAELEAALTMQRELLGDEHAEVASSLYWAGELAAARGDLDVAEEYHRSALAMRRAVFDVHQDIAKSLSTLALLLRERGAHDEAAALYSELLSGARKWMGEHHPAVARVLSDVARVQAERGERDAAIASLTEAVEIDRWALGPDHRETIEATRSLGGLLFESGRYGEAEPHLRRSCEAVGWDVADRTTREMLARCYEALGRADEAADWRSE